MNGKMKQGCSIKESPLNRQIINLIRNYFRYYPLKKLGCPKELADILSSEKIIKISVGVCDDIKLLREMVSFEPLGFVDLSDIARKKGLIQSGASALTTRY